MGIFSSKESKGLSLKACIFPPVLGNRISHASRNPALDGAHWGQKSGENASWKIQMEVYAVIGPSEFVADQFAGP